MSKIFGQRPLRNAAAKLHSAVVTKHLTKMTWPKSFMAVISVALITSASVSFAQSANPIDGIQNRMATLYPTATATADGADLVSAGAVLTLEKDHLMMDKVEFPEAMLNYYKDGAIARAPKPSVFASALGSLLGVRPQVTNQAVGNSAAPDTREFVSGEKFWVTIIRSGYLNGAIAIRFDLMSDPINDQRYKSALIFQWPKNVTPSPDEVAARVAEVIKVATTDASADANSASGGGQAATATKTIAIGQTRDEVIAMFGVPTKIVQLSTKEIDYFTDMKVTFVKNKVTDVK